MNTKLKIGDKISAKYFDGRVSGTVDSFGGGIGLKFSGPQTLRYGSRTRIESEGVLIHAEDRDSVIILSRDGGIPTA